MLPTFQGFVGRPQPAGPGPVTYLLDDTFTTPETAPVASPRTAEPGPGTLVLTQSAGSMNISSDALNLATAPTSWGAQGFCDQTQRTRTAGRRFVAQFTLTATLNGAPIYFGWNASASVNPSALSGFGLAPKSNGTSTIPLYTMLTDGNTGSMSWGSISTSTEYELMFVQRSVGYLVYIKGGSFTDWTLLTAFSSGNDNVYAAMGNQYQTGNINSILIPDNLWLPAPLVSDSFDSRDGTGNENYIARYVSNPVISAANNPNETTEQYQPAPIRLGSGDIWVYVKGTSEIYAWKSTDGGVTFALQNSNNPVIGLGTGGSWDDGDVLEPGAVYDSANNLVHLYYRGDDGSGNFAIGHATAPDSNPANVTKDAGNPILTDSDLQTALGLAATPNDLNITDIIKIGSTFYFYGTYQNASNNKYCIWYGTGADWDDVTPQATIITPDAVGGDLVKHPSVFKWSGDSTYYMIFSSGYLSTSSKRRLRIASSPDGINWTMTPGEVLTPEAGGAWEDTWVYDASILKESSSPFVAPIEISDKYLLYYSGFDGTGIGDTGLAYLQNNGGDTVETNFPVDNTALFGVSDGAGESGFSGGSGVGYDGTVKGAWKLSSTSLVPTGDVPVEGAAGWIAAYEGGAADGVAFAKLVRSTDSTIGFVFRYTNNLNFWMVTIGGWPSAVKIWEMNAGTLTDRASASAAFTTGTEYELVVVLDGQTIRARANEVEISYASASLNQTEQTHGFYAATIDEEIRSLVFLAKTATGDIGN
jgi:predicted GH43/DUF377 family glycosyl hydrolase